MVDPKRIWSSNQLPTLPIVAVKLIELSRSPDSGVRDYVELVRTDPAISAKLLKSANSTLFGLGTRVTSLDRAVPLLGTTVVTSLALSFSLVEAAMPKGALSSSYKDCWQHSVIQAAAAESLAALIPGGSSAEFFLAGLLADIGRLAMLRTIPEEYSKVVSQAEQSKQPLFEVEQRILGFDHASVGSNLSKHWKLPETLSAAIAAHHQSPETLLASKTDGENSLCVVLAMTACVGEYYRSPEKGLSLDRIRRLAHDHYSIPAEKVDQYLVDVKARIDAVAELFSLDLSHLADPADLMSEAAEQLAQLAVREHVASTQAQVRNAAIEDERRILISRNEQLKVQALRDPLTGVFNRAHFDTVLTRELAAASLQASTLGAIFIDVDHFKKVNDTYGHAAGDYVLQKVSRTLSTALRCEDLLARYGGEEFVAVFPQATEKGIAKIAERLRSEIESCSIMFEGRQIPVTASMGASLVLPGRKEEGLGARLLAAADQAMYHAKQTGRNRVEFRSLLSPFDQNLLNQVMQRRFSRWLVSKSVLDVAVVSRALLELKPIQSSVGELAVRLKLLTQQQVNQICSEQDASALRFGEIAVQDRLLTSEQLWDLLAWQCESPQGLATVLANSGVIDPKRIAELLSEYCRQSSLANRPQAAHPVTVR